MQKSRFARFASILAMTVGALLAAGCSQIDTGNVGVAKTAGKIDMKEVTPGWNLTWFASVSEVTTKEVSFGLDNLKPKAKDNLTIEDLDVDVYFQINPTLVAETVAKYQGDAVRHSDIVKGGTSDLVVGYSRVSREAREAVYRAVSEFPATSMHTKRAELSDRIRELLQAELSENDKDVWTITAINVRNLVTDPAIEKSIRETADVDMQVARAVKEKELATKRGEAQVEAARQQALANDTLSRSLTPQLLELKRLEAMTAFAKQGTHTVVLPGDGKSANVLLNAGK